MAAFSLLTRQLPFQTYLAANFCCVDFCLIAQHLYYYKPPSEESSPISANTPLFEGGLAHSVAERYGSTGSTSRLCSPVQFRRCSHARALHAQVSITGSCPLPSRFHPGKRATLRELQSTAASIAQAAGSLLHQQHGHQRPRSASYAGDSRPSALSRTSMGAVMCIP